MMHRTPKADNIPPFTELMISWNGERPQRGAWLFSVRVKIGEWSPWLPYASWGSDTQASFHHTTPDALVRTYQDAVEVLVGKATGFEVKVEGEDVTKHLRALHIYTNSDAFHNLHDAPSKPIRLAVDGLSQMALDHPRRTDLCSPTSTAAVVRYLARPSKLCPAAFAIRVWDQGFDIFGNWVLNVAAASAALGPAWHAWVERLSGFHALYERLRQGTPVVVSVRGPLPGSAQPYAKGHLMVVVGYDPEAQRVLCMDPAFASDGETHVSYALEDFLQAWSRRGRVAYVFSSAQAL